MKQPSEEAMELARKLAGRSEYAVAEAMQKLIDERDRYKEHWDGCTGAEATINDWRQHAEAAEAVLVEWTRRDMQNQTALAAAKARLADCVREVREWYGSSTSPVRLAAILDKYEPKR